LLIGEYLPLSSLAAFSLSCRSLYNAFGNRYLAALSRSPVYPQDSWYFHPPAPLIPYSPGVATVNFRLITPGQRQLWRVVLRRFLLRRERKAFLRLLDRDLLQYVNCQSCGNLHTPCIPTREGLALSFFTNMRLLLCDCVGIDPGFFPYKIKTYPQISISQIQMATKLHQIGMADVAITYLQALAGNSKYIKDEFNRLRERKHLWTSQPKIISQKLYVRSQHWFLMPRPAPGSEIYTSSLSYAVDSFHFMEEPRVEDGFTSDNVICPHVKMSTVGYYPAHEGRMMTPSLDICCRCGIEYRLDAKDYYPSGIAFIITTWRNLGAFATGEHRYFQSLQHTPDILDERKVCYGHASRISGKCGDSHMPQHQYLDHPRSVCSTFENGKEFIFDDCLSEADRAFLFGSSNVEMFWKRWKLMKYR
jgi:hypothetical protein